MGSTDLRDLCVINEVDEDRVMNRACAFDAHNWLYKYVTISVEYNNTRDYTIEEKKLPNLIGVPMGVAKMVGRGVKPIMVFDGGYHDLKEDELSRRTAKKEAAEKERKEETDKIRKSKLEARTQSITDEMLESTMEIFDIMGIPYMFAPEAGESQAAHICKKEEEVKFAVSDDYDTIVFGAPYTLRNFTSGSKSLEVLSIEETLNDLELTLEQFINVHILCGTDYNEGVHGYGPVTSVKKVKEYDSMEELMEEEQKSVENYEQIYELFNNPEVTDDYPEPQSIDNNVDELEEYLPDKISSKSRVKSSLDRIRENLEEPDTTSLSDF